MTNESRKKILIRVDASTQVGAGHLMRMLALGQILSETGYEVHFATIPYNHSILDFYLKNEEFKLHYLKEDICWNALKDIDEFLDIASRIQPSWVVIDGCHFDADYEHKIKTSGYMLLRIDDIPSHQYHADIILNQNFGADAMIYSAESNTKILAGLKYVLLRREFREVRPFEKKCGSSGPIHILVSLGGGTEKADALNSKIAQGLSCIPKKDVSVTLLVGKMSGKSSYFEKMGKNGCRPIEIKENCPSMAAEMLKADIAIVSVGSTMWELIYMNVPFLAVAVTEAQRNYLRLLSEHNLCVDLGWHEDLTSDLVSQLTLGFIQNSKLRFRMADKYKYVMDRSNIGKDLLRILGESAFNHVQ